MGLPNLYQDLPVPPFRWLGEHANQVSGSSAWKPIGKGPIELQLGASPSSSASSSAYGPSDPSERMALAAAALSPLLAAAISHLQRALLTGEWGGVEGGVGGGEGERDIG